MTAATLLAELDSQGIRLILDGEQLRVNAPRGVLTKKLRERLSGRKNDLLKALRKRSPFNWGGRGYEEVLTLSAEEFRQAGIAVVIFSELLGEEVYLVSNEAIMATLEGDGRAVYLPEEIQALEGLGEEQILGLHASKKILGGRILDRATGTRESGRRP